MGIFGRLSSVLVVVVAASGFHTSAIAQPTSSTQPKADETLADTLERTYFANDSNFYQNRTVGRQLDWMFGLNGFTENEISRDSAQIHSLYLSALKQQTQADPVLRTRDLPNPYETSILTSPRIQVNQRAPENEMIFENQ